MPSKAYSSCTLLCFIFIIIFNHGFCANRRPVYIIGHMINSIEEVVPFLEDGSNVLESDIQFHSNGSVKEIYHGCPGDCFRVCDRRVQLPDYLQYLRNITDPSTKNSYYDKLIMQFFDLKLESSKNKEKSGRDIAKHIIDYLWSNGQRKQEVRVLIYINEVDHKDAIYGFLKEFQDRGLQSRLKDVGFDGGMGDIADTLKMLKAFQINHIWQGDGTFNCNSTFYPDGRLKEELSVRDSSGYIKKVYDWTVDEKFKMRKSLHLGVDGFITNIPKHLVDVLNEEKYKQKFRIATTSDPPFSRFEE